MKTVKETIQIIHNDIAAQLPIILKAKGLSDFDIYGIGYPIDTEKLVICVRLSSYRTSVKEDVLTFIIHAQLYRMLDEQIYPYIDAINEYMDNFDERKVGHMMQEYEIIMIDKPRIGIEVLWEVTLQYIKDDDD